MSESFDLSAECDHLEFIQKGTKICGRCGTNIQALAKQTPASDVVGLEALTSDVQALDPARVKEFKNFVHQVLSDGNELADVLDALLDGAQDMGISQAQAVTLIEQTKQEQEQNTILELKLSYDASSARAGVANGNTVLAFRIENASKKNIQKLSISILHPQTKNKIHLKPVTGLLRGMQKTVETDLVLSLVGFHSVRDGIVSAQSLTGAIEDYAIASEIRIYAENSEAARANISSQSFTTNMGGVISADGANSAPSKKDQQARAWEPIRLVRLTAQQQELVPSVLAPVAPPTPEVSPAPVAAQTPVASGEDHKIIQPVKADKPEDVEGGGGDGETPNFKKPNQQGSADDDRFYADPAKEAKRYEDVSVNPADWDSIPYMEQDEAEEFVKQRFGVKEENPRQEPTPLTTPTLQETSVEVDEDDDDEIPAHLKFINPFENLDLGPPLRILQAEDFSSIEKARTTFEEILNDFVRLLQILAQTDPRDSDVVWLRQQIDYFQLRQISNNLEIEPYDILAINTEVTENGRRELSINGAAVIISSKGLYRSDNLSVASRHFFASWKDLQADGFLISEEFGKTGSYVTLSSAAYGSFLIFKMGYLSTKLSDDLVSRLTKRFEQLLSTDEIIRKLDAQKFY
jgi:hypothetical protein